MCHHSGEATDLGVIDHWHLVLALVGDLSAHLPAHDIIGRQDNVSRRQPVI